MQADLAACLNFFPFVLDCFQSFFTTASSILVMSIAIPKLCSLCNPLPLLLLQLIVPI
ncbi:hypothetical protein OAD33_08845 [Alphaproteobacteria bacterium]|nr:hypothetical protein [Alphaproteobacteria bacterium]